MSDEIAGYTVKTYLTVGDYRYVVTDEEYKHTQRHVAVASFERFKKSLAWEPKTKLKFDSVEFRVLMAKLIEKYPE